MIHSCRIIFWYDYITLPLHYQYSPLPFFPFTTKSTKSMPARAGREEDQHITMGAAVDKDHCTGESAHCSGPEHMLLLYHRLTELFVVLFPAADTACHT